MEIKILQFLLFLCMKLLVSGVGAAEFRCIERERQALLKIAESLTGDLSELTMGSEEDKENCCKWHGVGCGGTAHVTFLDLSGMHLRGKMSPALQELQHLNHLDLGDNYLTMDNLDWLSNVSSLSYLHLSGINLRTVTNWVRPISKLSSLEELYLSDITRFSSLQELYLSNNQLDGVQPQTLDQPSSLKILDLSYNQISGSLSDLRGFSSLKRLDLSGNQLKKLPKAIEKLFNLNFLNLSSTSLEGTITEHHLSNFTHLSELDLSFNNVSFNLSFDWIPPFQLKSVHFSHCNMGPHFPNWIRTQNSLTDLSLSFAGISDTLPNWLWNMSSIDYIDLSHNNISGGMPDLALKSFAFYDSVDLSYNNLSGSIFTLCPKVSIQNLILSHNQLEGELPDCWMNLQEELIVLNLAYNKFSGKLPPTLSTLEHLAILHLGNNNFTGELPSLKNFRELRKLDVGRNKLTGTIPAWIGHLKKLAVLSLRFNSFHGSIPPTICYLTNIYVLDLSRNNISGKIPQCLNNLTSLVRNCGSTMSEYYSFIDKVPSDEDDNAVVQWKGQDAEYKRLRNLKGIDLSSNKLVGTIPHAFSDLRALVFINLSRNHLVGNIISSIGQLDTLEWLDLSRNQLSGEIPNGLANLHFLSVLDLSYNNLTGKIPLSTQLQSFNSSAYAGNNQLCGDPLAECPHDPSVTDRGKVNVVEEDDGFMNRDFYICMAFGFITGFYVRDNNNLRDKIQEEIYILKVPLFGKKLMAGVVHKVLLI
ncbi:unnamed protein product [Fraxinus pennsylvanica]|uniref:Leucine-rich repeat-containing N-terminal plant-type domain-containing protein n=1 Tax=Fraxinus pennsylvanica TaxID=56036 RepID=A0AAD2A7M8_9LAMI|nr:unnamed protein product [Fraxinus pennsylvanica]